MQRGPAEQQRDCPVAGHVLVIADKGADVLTGSAEAAFAKFAPDEMLHRTRQGNSQTLLSIDIDVSGILTLFCDQA